MKDRQMIGSRKTLKKMAGVLAAASLLFLANQGVGAEPIRMLLLTGGHPYDFDEFHAMFAQMEGVVVTHVELEDHAEVFEDIAGWPYDTIVFYNMTHELTDRRLENLFTLTEWGVGMVPLHHGTLSWTPQPRVKEIFGVQFPDAGPFGFHLNQEFTYNIIDPNHPITDGMESFDVIDETYTNYYGEGVEGNHVLITTDHEPADPELVLVRHVNNSRIASIQGGHDRLTFEDPNYINLLYRAILWTSGRLPLEVGGEGLPNSTIYREHYELPALMNTLVDYDASQSRIPLTTLERRLSESGSPEILRVLVDVALDDSLSMAVRTWTLRQLGYHGRPTDLDAVAPLLLDGNMADISRYTMEQSVHDRADQILMDAFEHASGDIRRGLAITMTRRQSDGIVNALASLLDGDDPNDIMVGATSLGEIGGSESLPPLLKKVQEVDGDNLIVLQDALLSWAGISKGEESISIHSDLRTTGATPIIRSSAWLGYLAASEATIGEIATALGDEDPLVRRAAINSLPLAKSSTFVDPLLEKLGDLDEQEQITVLYKIEERNDTATLPILHELLKSENEDVHVNAIYVAGSLGNDETARLLISQISEVPQAAREVSIKSLAAISGEDIGSILVESLDSDHAAVRVALIQAIALRLEADVLDVLFSHTYDEEGQVRAAAFNAIGEMGDDETFARLLAQFMETETAADLRFANRALTDIRRRSEAQDDQLANILAVLPSANEAQAGLLIGTIATGSTDAAAEALGRLLNADEESLRLAAIRSLSGWPNAAPADSLLEIASGDNAREAALAARGYLTVLARDSSIRSNERLEWARRVAPYIQSTALKTQYISVVSSSPSLDALNEVSAFLGDEDVQREAFLAIQQLAPTLSLIYPDEVLAALTQMVESPDLPEELRDKAAERIEFLAEYSERVVANWNFFDGTDGWIAENQCVLEPRAGYLHAISEGDDPFMSIEVDIEEQPLLLQFRVRHEERVGLFQFFIRTDQVQMGYPGSMLNFQPRPSNGDWVEYEVPFTPVGNMEVFRFDFAITPVAVDIDYIRLLRQ